MEALPGAPAQQFLPLREIIIIICRQRFQLNHALCHGFGQLHEKPEVRDSGNNSVKNLPNLVLQQNHGHALENLALGGLGGLLVAVDRIQHFRKPRLVRQWSVTGKPQGMLERAVREQVGVAANGRGKMAVAVRGQAEMTFIVQAVLGLHHGAQHQTRDHKFRVRSRCGSQDAGQGAWARLFRQFRKAGALEHFKQPPELVRVRRRMYAIGQGLMPPGQKQGRGFIGRDHKHFDELMGKIVFLAGQQRGLASRVHPDLRFGQLKIQPTGFLAPGMHQPGQFLGSLKHLPVRGEVIRKLALISLLPLNYFLKNLRVGEPGMALDNCGVKFTVGFRPAFGVKIHTSGHGQARRIRAQAA